MKEELFHLIVGDIVSSQVPWVEMKKWRKAFNVKGKDVAKSINVSPSVISDYESGRRKSPGLEMIKKIVRAMIDLTSVKDSYDKEVVQRDLDFESLARDVDGAIVVHPIEKHANGVVFADGASIGNCFGLCIISDMENAVLIFSMLSSIPNFFIVSSVSDVEKAIARKFGFGVIVADVKKAKEKLNRPA